MQNYLTSLIIISALYGCSGSVEPAAGINVEFTEPIGITPTQPAEKLQSSLESFIYSMEDKGYFHLFTLEPQNLIPTRLTAGEWNDINPAPSPDGKRLAFASDRAGYWDLFILDLSSGEITQITKSDAYDSEPSWSPDGQWLVFNSYIDENLEIVILSLNDPSLEIIRLTDNASSDHSPAWSPDGRRIAFVSTRTGDSDIWLADLDLTGTNRFRNLSNTPQVSEGDPAWDSKGMRLLWTSSDLSDGYSGIYLWDSASPSQASTENPGTSRPVQRIGDGSQAAWNTSDDALVAVFSAPNQEFLSAYTLKGNLLLTPFHLPGRIRGLSWSRAKLPEKIPDSIVSAAALTPTALWAPAVSSMDDVPAGRWLVVSLPGVQAPYPQLHDLVDEAFIALRNRVENECGWDALSSLENAYVPLSAPLHPGFSEDWLYTGRAFAINSLMANAGWMVALREDYAGQTYWRLFLRCTNQDGSQGEPIMDNPWELTARYELDPRTYELGGRYAPIPPGYWVDVTRLASSYGWERVPALPNWRSYFSGTRFTEFVMTSGMDWYSAMLELYPAEVLVTPTRLLPPTLTPTRTPIPSSTPGPSRTPRPTGTPTATRGASPTSPPTDTPAPTSTPPTIIP